MLCLLWCARTPETVGDELETAGDSLEMFEAMKTAGKTLRHTQFAPGPVRRASIIVVVVVVVVVVVDKISKLTILSTPGAGHAPFGLNPAGNASAFRRRTRKRGIPITIAANMRHSQLQQEVCSCSKQF